MNEIRSIMKRVFFKKKRELQSVLLVLLLYVMGIGKMYSYSFTSGDLKYTVNNDGTSVTVNGLAQGVYAWGPLSIPETVTYNGTTYSVTTIGASAFQGHVGFSGSLTIGNSVTTIEDCAFMDCIGFTGSLTIPNSVITIGNCAFWNCEGFTGNLTIGNSVTTIGNRAFADCDGFTGSLTIGNSVTTIGWSAFLFCSGFTGNLVIPNSVVSIEESAFTFCYGFTGLLMLSNSLISIGDYAFESCWGFSGSLVIPNSVTTIGQRAFFDCYNLTGTLNIPNSVVSIGSSAFVNCDGLSGILTIPSSVIYIGDNPFGYYYLEGIIVESGNPMYDSRANSNAIIETNTNKLVSGCQNTVIPNSVTSIGNGAFKGCAFLTSIEIPNSVTSLGDYAFYDCMRLASIEIPNNVTSIGQFAFYYCRGLTSIEIPNSVTSIGNYAFYACDHLACVTILAYAVPSLSYGIFMSTHNSLKVYVPYESLNAYKTSTNWSDYASIIYPMAYTTISAFGEGSNHWHFIASPLMDSIDPTVIERIITETEYDLYQLVQSDENGEWKNYKVDNFILVNGKGYLYANEGDANIIFMGEFNEDETKEVNLNYDVNACLAGWNLVGNPFPCHAYINRNYYVMNEDGTTINPIPVSSTVPIPPCTGVMVKAEAEGGTVVFTKVVP